jgi:hypothetical protein
VTNCVAQEVKHQPCLKLVERFSKMIQDRLGVGIVSAAQQLAPQSTECGTTNDGASADATGLVGRVRQLS